MSDPCCATARPASVLVSVPELADASFSAFFGSAAAGEGSQPALDCDWDLDSVRRSADLAGAALSDRVRVRRRCARASRNPVRALSERIDLRMEYEEVRLGVGESHIKLAKKEERKWNSSAAAAVSVADVPCRVGAGRAICREPSCVCWSVPAALSLCRVRNRDLDVAVVLLSGGCLKNWVTGP